MSSSLASLIASLPKQERTALLSKLSLQEQERLLFEWRFWARPEQLPPERNLKTTDGAWRTWLLLSGRGFGKMLDDRTPIPTPSGWTTMGEINKGTAVFDETGRPCLVTAKYSPIVDEQYRIKFSDGSYLDACGDHQWVTWSHAERKAFLRSPYEDTSRFPSEWPQWRLKQLRGTAWLDRDVVEQALALREDGLTMSAAAVQLGRSRQALARHFRANKFIRRVPAPNKWSIGPQIRTTKEILGSLTYGKRGDLNHCIPCCGALQMPDRALPVPPYTLGLWLGDGSKKDGTFTAHEDDMPFLRERLFDEGVITTDRRDTQSFGTLGLASRLSAAGVLNNKHVPAIYLRASVAQRLALLRGLMDSDGNIERGNTVAFCNTNYHLIEAVNELVNSLGMKTRTRTGIGKYNGKYYKRFWVVQFAATTNPFSLPRKALRITVGGAHALRNHHRMIVSVEKIDPVPMSCITVDSKNSMYLAGKAMIPTHNTRSAAEWVREQVEAGRRRSIGLIGPTKESTRKTMVEGESGMLSICPPWNRPIFEPSNQRLIWPSGAVAHLFTAEEPEKLRGPNLDCAWGDEVCAWGGSVDSQGNIASGNNRVATQVYDMLSMCLRIPGPMGHPPQEVLSTTPKPMPLLRQIMKTSLTVITGGSTFDNEANLDGATLRYLKEKYEDTRLGRQELLGEVLDAFEGALWSPEMLDRNRLALARDGQPGWKVVRDMTGTPHLVGPNGERRYFKRVVVAIDPAGSRHRRSNETGLIAAGLGDDEDGYVLEDQSGIYAPEEWARRAVEMLDDWRGDRIIAEANYGGDMVEGTLRAVQRNAPLRIVNATTGKRLRAEPIAALDEKGRIHHVGQFEKMEDQMVTWDPLGDSESPDRLDARVWAFTELMLRRQASPRPLLGYIPRAVPIYQR